MDKNANRKIGQAGVCRVKSELLLRGWSVSEPEVDEGVDIIAYDSRNHAVRLQIKASTQFHAKTKSARFYTSKITPKATKKRAAYNPAEVDFLVCVCLPTNEFWIVPACDVKGRVKMHMTIKDDYHGQWVFLTTTKQKMGGDKYWSERSLTMEVNRLQDYNERLLKKLKEAEANNEINEHKIGNFFRFLRQDYLYQAVVNIENYGTIYDEEEWGEKHFGQDRVFLERNLASLQRLRGLLDSKPANGAQGEPATVGLFPLRCRGFSTPGLVPAHETKPEDLKEER